MVSRLSLRDLERVRMTSPAPYQVLVEVTRGVGGTQVSHRDPRRNPRSWADAENGLNGEEKCLRWSVINVDNSVSMVALLSPEAGDDEWRQAQVLTWSLVR